MKRLIVATVILLFLLGKPTQAMEPHTLYFPLVFAQPVAVIDCMNGDGHFVECEN